MLEALADPDHERHADMREWLGEEVDPFDFKPPPLRAALAGRRFRNPTIKKPRFA
jgi:hypothetical protein